MPIHHLRIITLLAPVLVLIAADGEPAAAPSPAPAKVPVAAKPNDGTLNNVDLRLIIGGGGGLNKVRNQDTDAETNYDSGSGGTLAIHALYLRAHPGGVGFAVGGGFFAHAFDGEPENTSGPTSTVSAAGVDITAAFVYRPTRNWHFELPALVLSGGRAKVETDVAPDVTDGAYGRLALEVGAYYTFDFGLQLGANLGGAGFAATFDQDVAPGITQQVTYSGSGAYFNLVAGFRF